MIKNTSLICRNYRTLISLIATSTRYLDTVVGMGCGHKSSCLPHVKGHVGDGLGVLGAGVEEASCHHVGIPYRLNLCRGVCGDRRVCL